MKTNIRINITTDEEELSYNLDSFESAIQYLQIEQNKYLEEER